MEEEGPTGSANQDFTNCEQLSLEVLVFTVWRWVGAQKPPECICRRHCAFCAGVDILHHQCCDLLLPEPSWVPCVATAALSTPRCRMGCECLCLSTASSAEGQCCYILCLLNRTSKIFNLALSNYVSWVQTAYFYMNTYINIVILSDSSSVVHFFWCANGSV